MSTSAKLNVVIGGGTGLIGRVLKSKLLSKNANVRIITRDPKRNGDLSWDDPGVDYGFLARLVRDWEAACSGTQLKGVQRVLVRTGIVLSKNGGALSKMYLTHRLGLGSPIGSGQQWLSWIHIDDLVNLYCFLIMNPAGLRLSDAVNGTAPYPVRQGAFSHALSEALGAPSIGEHIPMPAFMIRAIMGKERAPLLLEGQKVLPVKAQAAGFEFDFPTLELALENIYGKRPQPVPTN
ncbi:unnamed protein product [Taenia asiatica]|uniref:DUF1731 domain-containing protein n=1 Tax=Taenia asiatica TaxID=60517 RepID=A0A0R3WAS6_TAEAS|nr:unnamed protein product [Taenia asiatica]